MQDEACVTERCVGLGTNVKSGVKMGVELSPGGLLSYASCG